jgi:hypothetical protein
MMLQFQKNLKATIMSLGMLQDDQVIVYYLFLNAFYFLILLKDFHGFYFIYLIIVLREFFHIVKTIHRRAH